MSASELWRINRLMEERSDAGETLSLVWKDDIMALIRRPTTTGWVR